MSDAAKPDEVTITMTGLEAMLCQMALDVYAAHPEECLELAGHGITNEYATAMMKRLSERLGASVVALENNEEAIRSFARMLRYLA